MVNMFVHSLHSTYQSGNRYASSASVTWLVCSAWEFTETREFTEISDS